MKVKNVLLKTCPSVLEIEHSSVSVDSLKSSARSNQAKENSKIQLFKKKITLSHMNMNGNRF